MFASFTSIQTHTCTIDHEQLAAHIMTDADLVLKTKRAELAHARERISLSKQPLRTLGLFIAGALSFVGKAARSTVALLVVWPLLLGWTGTRLFAPHLYTAPKCGSYSWCALSLSGSGSSEHRPRREKNPLATAPTPQAAQRGCESAVGSGASRPRDR